MVGFLFTNLETFLSLNINEISFKIKFSKKEPYHHFMSTGTTKKRYLHQESSIIIQIAYIMVPSTLYLV